MVKQRYYNNYYPKRNQFRIHLSFMYCSIATPFVMPCLHAGEMEFPDGGIPLWPHRRG